MSLGQGDSVGWVLLLREMEIEGFEVLFFRDPWAEVLRKVWGRIW